MKITLKIALGLLVLVNTLTITAQTIKASSFGFNASDATDAFREALKADYDTIIIDKQAADWNVKPNKFFNLTNKVIIFEPGVVLRAKANEFNASTSKVFELIYPENLIIIGYGAELVMNKYELDQQDHLKSEYRHGISIIAGKNITIKGFTIRNTCGDGVYIGGSGVDDETGYSKNIYLEDLKIINAYRQGLTIISVENFYAKNCLVTETKGTLPEAGFGYEPNDLHHRAVNVNFENCAFTNNNHAGIKISPIHSDGNSLPLSFSFKDCYLTNNHVSTNKYVATEIQLGASKDYLNPVKGYVNFERVFIENSQWRAVFCKKGSDTYRASFKDCVFKDVAQNTNYPIYLEAAGDGDGGNLDYFIGGIDFENVLISYTNDKPFLRAGYFKSKGVNNMVGSFKIVNPNLSVEPIEYKGTSKVVDTDITYEIIPELPLSEVSFKKKNNIAVEATDSPVDYEVNRSGSTAFPLAVSYDVQGEAISGDDFGLLTKSLIIPSNASSTSKVIHPRKDDVSEIVEDFSLILQPSSHYTLGGEEQLNFQIYDEEEVDVPIEETELPLRINVGGPTTIYQGDTFIADKYFSGGQSFENTRATVESLHQTERSSGEAVFNYNIPLENGTYEVTLHFAEIYWGATGGGSGGLGKRVFDVDIEDSNILNDYDITADVGAQKAISKTFTVIVSDGALNMNFDAQGSDGIDQPKLSAIEIIEESVITDFDLRINAGGPTIDYQGETFIADQYFEGGQSFKNTSATVTSLYQTERSSEDVTFNYNIPLENGTYEVTLHFSEIYWGATGGASGGSGERVFDVDIEGVTVLNDYDITKDVGAQTAVAKTYTVKVSDGVLNLKFDGQESDHADQPKLSALEITNKINNVISGADYVGGSSDVKISNEAPSSVEEIVSEIVLFPNPTSNTLTIKGIDSEKTISIYSFTGQVLQSLQVSEYEITLSLGDYPSGIYLVQIMDENAVNTFKIIKK